MAQGAGTHFASAPKQTYRLSVFNHFGDLFGEDVIVMPVVRQIVASNRCLDSRSAIAQAGIWQDGRYI